MKILILLIRLCLKSIWNRKVTATLTILSVALSVSLLLGIERVRSGAKSSFESTVSGIDLIMGARSGPINLLMYSVFRIGNATNNVSYASYKDIVSDKKIAWSIPISLGDSHKGYKVIGTTEDYYKHYRYSKNKSLQFEKGSWAKELFDVVVGSEVAKKLNYKIGDQIALSHGTDLISFQEHADKPFKIVGILEPTYTPVDQSLHISLKAMRALHLDWADGAPPLSGHEITPDEILSQDILPADITAVFIKLKSRIEVFNVQRHINEFKEEPLLAILPGVSLRDLWMTLSVAENSLLFISGLVFVVSLMGMLMTLLATLQERQRELAVLRSVGAGRFLVFSMLIFEGLLLVGLGCVAGLLIIYISLWSTQSWIESQLNMPLNIEGLSFRDGVYICIFLISAVMVSLIPAQVVYRRTLAEGLIAKY